MRATVITGMNLPTLMEERYLLAACLEDLPSP